ncbi:hypothetical protein H5410_013623 [Solanum commersonii]|uniref:Uncharacterized protein n=1 Tax=Solanum commersonii TaxID=4109 RepID=A0A9J5ZNZ8_SOLCO|nr:hypothetical protein H5410_013623 [Solanum commersonii]
MLYSIVVHRAKGTCFCDYVQSTINYTSGTSSILCVWGKAIYGQHHRSNNCHCWPLLALVGKRRSKIREKMKKNAAQQKKNYIMKTI